MNYIDDYKNNVLKAINSAKNINNLIESHKNFNDSERLSEIINQINNTIDILQKDKITISVVAAFAAGKSSFINGLIFGDEVLHASVGETTLKIYKIQYGKDIKITYKEKNGKDISIIINSLDDLKEEIKKLNQDEEQSRYYDKFVNIFFPSPLLEQGLVLIDTPGLNSIREEIIKTYVEDALIESDAVIFITNIDQGANKEDRFIWKEYFKNIQPDSKRWILLNKLDSILTNEMLEENEKESQIEKSLVTFSKTVNEDDNYKIYRIYPISARMALIGKKKSKPEMLEKSRLKGFETDLFKSLTDRRYNEYIYPQIQKIESYVLGLTSIYTEKFDEMKNKCNILESEKLFNFEQGARISATIEEVHRKMNGLRNKLNKLSLDIENEFKGLSQALTSEFETLLIKNLEDFGFSSVFSINNAITNILNKTCKQFEENVKSNTEILSNNISRNFASIFDDYQIIINMANKELNNLGFVINNEHSNVNFSFKNDFNSPNDIKTDDNFFAEISKSIALGAAIDSAIVAILNYLAKNLGIELAKQILARVAINGIPVIGQIISIILAGFTIYNFPGNIRDKVKNEARPKVSKEIQSNINFSSDKLKQEILSINNALIDKTQEMSSYLKTAKIKTSNNIEDINKNILNYKNNLDKINNLLSDLKKVNVN